MKTFRLLSVVAVLFAFAGASFSQDKKDEIDAAKLVGKWQPTKKSDTIIELMKGGKLSITQTGADGKKMTMEGTYVLTGRKMQVKFKSPEGTEIEHLVTIKSLDGDKMVTIRDKDPEEEFKRMAK